MTLCNEFLKKENNPTENGETSCLMFDDVVQDVRENVASVVSAKTGDVEERFSKRLS